MSATLLCQHNMSHRLVCVYVCFFLYHNCTHASLFCLHVLGCHLSHPATSICDPCQQLQFLHVHWCPVTGQNAPQWVKHSLFFLILDALCMQLFEFVLTFLKLKSFLSHSSTPTTETAPRPRKPCNCTKSQCLKL